MFEKHNTIKLGPLAGLTYNLGLVFLGQKVKLGDWKLALGA